MKKTGEAIRDFEGLIHLDSGFSKSSSLCSEVERDKPYSLRVFLLAQA
jgi:hypothetical protein